MKARYSSPTPYRHSSLRLPPLLLPIRFLNRPRNPLGPTQLDSRPTHPQRQHNHHHPRGDPQHKDPLNRHHSSLEHPPLHSRIQRPQKRASGPRNRSLHVRFRHPGKQVRDGVLCEIEKNGVGHGERDGDSGYLGARDKADGQGDFLGWDEPLRDRKGRVDEEAGAQPAKDERGVDVGGTGGEGDVEEHDIADDDEEAAG